MSPSPKWSERLYTLLTKDADGEACRAISKEACEEAPGNFLRLLLARTCTKIGDRLASPKTTLAWILQAVGAPSIFAGLIVPIRESGSLLPQLFLAGIVRQMALRKWAWVLGAILQGMAIAGCGLSAMQLEGAAAGGAILGLIAIFSLARGLSSVSSKDILGKTIPKRRRGQLVGWVGSASGVVAIVAGAALLFPRNDEASMTVYVLYLLGAALLWLLAAVAHSFVVEFPGETEESTNVWGETVAKLKILRKDTDFRNFVVVRALAIGSGLSAPFIITLAHQRLGGAALWLGVFIIVDGVAAMLSSPLWGRFSDVSSRNVLRFAMLGTTFLLLVVVGLSLFELPLLADRILFPLIFFGLGIVHSGVRLGRKTYLVDMAEGNQRTDYVAVSNTVIGILLLAAGAITGALSLLSIPLALIVFAACALAGAVLGSRLPDVSG
jgi:hypothetical protein